MTLILYPSGYIKDMLHNQDLKENPERHYLTKDSYSREEAQEMCVYCANNYKYNEKFIYNAQEDKFYKIKDKAHD